MPSTHVKCLGLLSSLLSSLTWAAACCGGASTFPSLIVGDERAQLGFASAYNQVVGDVSVDGRAIFRSSKDKERNFIQSVDGGFLLSDRWQMGGLLPLHFRSRSIGTRKSSDWNLGDVSSTLAYEAMPEYSYSRWRPRVYVFFQSVFPSGGNIYEAKKTYAVDAHGKGFLTFLTGVYFLKAWQNWDASFRSTIGKSIPRNFNTTSGLLRVEPSFEGSLGMALGWSPSRSAWRYGLMLNPVFEGPTNVGASKLVWNSSLDLTWMFLPNWVSSLSYLDQTLMGPAKNVSLSRGLSVSLKHRWDR